jgi:hypothetical protein
LDYTASLPNELLHSVTCQVQSQREAPELSRSLRGGGGGGKRRIWGIGEMVFLRWNRREFDNTLPLYHSAMFIIAPCATGWIMARTFKWKTEDNLVGLSLGLHWNRRNSPDKVK